MVKGKILRVKKKMKKARLLQKVKIKIREVRVKAIVKKLQKKKIAEKYLRLLKFPKR